jgi:ABC-type uncharacterized transport system involved in gliding motility auxiliary subunit
MRRAGLIGSILLLVVLFFAVNMLAGALLRGVRYDATEGQLFTLTTGSRNIARSFEEPVTLTLYYSAKLAQGRADIQSYAQRVNEMLDEFARLSNGKIRIVRVDPAPSSEEEDEAVAQGIANIPVNTSDFLYFGLVGTNSVETREVIPFLDPSRERFLEYDIARLLYSLNNPKKKVVGLISSLQLTGGFSFNPQTRQPVQTPAWQVAQYIRGTFELRPLGTGVTSIPEDIDVLMIVHPKNLSDETLFAIDQFVLKGGRVLAFIDPFCESDEQAGQDPTQRFSQFSKLLDAWGVEVVRGRIAADKAQGQTVVIGGQQRPERVLYVGWLGVKGDQITKDDPITGQLQMLNFATAGHIRAKDVPTPEGKQPLKAGIAPLATTTAGAWEMPVEEVLFQPDPRTILEHYQAGTQPLTLAARLSGMVRTAFPDGIPSSDPDKPATPPGLTQSEGSINVILVADADMLADSQWVRVQNFFGQQLAQAFANNGDFVINALDNLSGSRDLIMVRARQERYRGFEVVDAMRRRAEERFAAEQKALQMKVQDTQTRLMELQAKRGSEEGSFMLSPEQEAELAKLRAEFAESRKQLRAVRRNLTKDIEALGTKLKFINIALVPALVTIGAVGMGALRAARRRRGAL